MRVSSNTGSKQGITTPPGDPAYNVSKAGVKAFTEALQHELRNTPSCKVSAHLLIPGFVFTPLTSKGRSQKPAGAWTPDETVDFMLSRLEVGDIPYSLSHNDVDRRTDEQRILWAAGDIVENRPPLSRWHPDTPRRSPPSLRDADGRLSPHLHLQRERRIPSLPGYRFYLVSVTNHPQGPIIEAFCA